MRGIAQRLDRCCIGGVNKSDESGGLITHRRGAVQALKFLGIGKQRAVITDFGQQRLRDFESPGVFFVPLHLATPLAGFLPARLANNFRFMVDNCICNATIGNMPFIQFPFIEVPKELHKLVGEPTPGTRAYRREGSFKECGEWLEKLGEYYKGDVGLSTSSVVLFVPVSRASVYKRIKEGKLTAFFFYVTHEETRLFGAKRRAKERPFIVVSVSECKAWAEEIKRRVGFVDDPDESLFKESERLLQAGGGDEPTEQEAKEAVEFTERDPKDKGNRKVKYQKERSTIDEDYKQQDMLYLLTELKAAMASPEKATALRRRLRKGVEWDKAGKTWKLKEEK
jgi:hypothetical protein